jgi:hypothetical protein
LPASVALNNGMYLLVITLRTTLKESLDV